MNAKNNVVTIDQHKKSRKRFVRSLEYELIASLAYQQFAKEDAPHFKALLSIPARERIPSLVEEYGMKRMHRLVKMVLQEFCLALRMPRSSKLTETKIAVCACDLILAAEEDHMSLEDLIIFFELARKGYWGAFRSVLTHYEIMEKLERFRQQRYEVLMEEKARLLAEQKAAEAQERIASQPTSIQHLMTEEGARIIPFQRPAS